MFRSKLSDEERKELQRIIPREGTFGTVYRSPDLFDANVRGGILFEHISGKSLIRVARTDDLMLEFYHSSPGLGTRKAVFDLRLLKPSDKLALVLTWSPERIAMTLASLIDGEQMHDVIGEPSAKALHVGEDGSVIELGDSEVEVSGARVYKSGQPIIRPTAIQLWKETMTMVELLASGTSTEGIMFEVAIANATIVTLVAGFEGYLKGRFMELEPEGRQPDLDSLMDKFIPKKERDAEIANALKAEASELDISLLTHLVNRRIINFQNYDDAKQAYKRAFGIPFSDLGVSSQTIGDLKRFIEHRHRVIHVEALALVFGIGGKPELVGKQLAQKAMGCFDEFVSKVHEHTL